MRILILLLLSAVGVAEELPGGLRQSEYEAFLLDFNYYISETRTTDPQSVPLYRRIEEILSTDFSELIGEKDNTALATIAKEHHTLSKSLTDAYQTSVCDFAAHEHVDDADIYRVIYLEEQTWHDHTSLHENTYDALVADLSPGGLDAVNKHVDGLAGSMVIRKFDQAGLIRAHPRAMAYLFQRDCRYSDREVPSACPYSESEVSELENRKKLALAKWRGLDLRNYEFEYSISGMRVSEKGVVSVLGNIAVLPEDSQFETRYGTIRSIDQVHASIETRSANVCVDAEFDPELGYPSRYLIRASDPMTSDSEFAIEISNFVSY